MPSIFLSYRRADSPDTVKLLYERLKARLPRWDIFYDHEQIAPGEKFPERLRSEVSQATVVLVIIGPQWVHMLQERQHEAIDHVRAEVELALKSESNVLPVLINRAELPKPGDLGNLQPLLERNARPLRPDPDFDGDLEVLIDHLKQLGGSEAVGSILADKYTLTAEIGAGGMGVVFLAQQKQPVQRTVAVKLIKPGMDSREVLARFDAERQALAVMDHANVARVLDAGLTPSGRPFFVMEYVKGVPITQFCDDKKLSPRQRLELFISVCNAVQHAHQKGIIHRDIKPSNVLVEISDGKAVPKVIDFGLAKALGQKLTDMTLHTAFDTRVGTLEYSSPEQAAGRAFEVDTRSDVYSLGALLYELLTGAPPFTREELLKAGEERMRQMIREIEPTKPSKKLSSSGELPAISLKRGVEPARLPGLVRGDLDWIVMKCLEKEPARRYATSSQLGEELQRVLSEQPVQAGPPSARYRFKKFLRRNKGTVLAASLIVLAVLGGLVGTGVGLVLAKQAADREKLAAEKLLDANEKEREHELEDVRRAEQKKRDDERTEIAVTSAFKQALDMRRQYRFKQARAMLTQADGLVGLAGNPALRRQVQTAIDHLQFVEQLDRIRQDKVLLVQGQIRREIASPRYYAALVSHKLDILHGDETALAEAVVRSPLRNELLAALDDWLGLEPDSVKRERLCRLTAKITGHAWRAELAEKWGDEMQLTVMLNDVAPDEMTVALLVSICSRITALDGDSTAWLDRARFRAPGDFWIWFELGSAHLNLYLGQGPNMANLQKGKEYAAISAQAFHGCVAIRPDSAFAWCNLGNALANAGNPTGAIAASDMAIKLEPTFATAFFIRGGALQKRAEYDKAMETFGEALRLDPKNALGFQMRALAWTEMLQFDKAIEDYNEAVRLDPENALAFFNRGMAWSLKQSYDKAIKDFDEALRLDPKIALGFEFRGLAWLEKKNFDKAIRDFDEALRLDPKNAQTFGNRGSAWSEKKEFDKAFRDFDEALRLDPKNALTFGNRGYTWSALNDYDKAIKDFDEAIRLDAKNAVNFRNRGYAWAEKKDFDKAIKDYDEAIRLDPKFSLAFDSRGYAWSAKNDFDKAIKDFDEAIRLGLKHSLTFNNRGNSWLAIKEYDKAVKDFDEAIRLDPKNALPLRNRGNVWLEKKEFDNAIKDYDEAIRLAPKDFLTFLYRGNAWMEKKEYDKAIKNFDESIRLDPMHSVAFGSRGYAWSQKKEYDKAIKDYDQAIRLNPKDNLVFTGRGLVFYEKKEYARSIKDFEEAIRLDPQFAGAYALQIAALPAAKQYLAASVAAKNAAAKLPKEAWPEVRYNAACAFALAGCGTGDAAKLTEKERKPLRAQALAWLREELAAYEKLAALPDAAAREAAIGWFSHVKQDSDFDGVRDAKALAQFDENERVQWQRFWQAVDAALKKAQSP